MRSVRWRKLFMEQLLKLRNKTLDYKIKFIHN